MLHLQTTLNCRGQLIDLSTPKVMGILNLTPDSFYDGSNYLEEAAMMQQVARMLEEGATFIDIGGMSSRPGAELIDVQEEMSRVLPALKMIRKSFPEALISIDTMSAQVARSCLEEGAHLVNDISAGQLDSAIWEVVADYQVPYVMMHMKGLPGSMQHDPTYEQVVLEILDFFIPRVRQLVEKGLHDIIIDVGFGFGKTVEHNYELLNKLHTFQILEKPLLVGISRKSMICKVLNISPKEALNGTTALHMAALQQGASILRVHDVKEAVECIELWQKMKSVRH